MTNWCSFLKELLKTSKIFSQCEKRYKRIWNSKNATSIDRKDFKMQNESKDCKDIKEARSFAQK